MGIGEPTTSGLDLLLLCRLSYKVGQRKSDFPESNGRYNPEVVGSIPTEVKIFLHCPRVVPESLTGANAQWVIHGFN